MPVAAQAEHPAGARRGRREVPAAQENRLKHRRGAAAALGAGLLLAFGAAALEAPQWPPPEAEAARMRELQAEISARESTPAQREAARRELAKLLKAPGAPRESAPPTKSPPRAAIEPFAPIVAPVVKPLPPVDPSDVARLEVVGPSRAIVNPRTGTVAAPLGAAVIDLRSGTVLQETPSGYVDPRGRLIPK